MREGIGVVVYARSAFPAALGGSVFVPLVPPLPLPFHLAVPGDTTAEAVRGVVAVARELAAGPDGDPSRPPRTSRS